MECVSSQVKILKARLAELGSRKPYSWSLRLKVLWHMEYFSVPRRRIGKHLGIPRGTLYRWLHRLEEGRLDRKTAQVEPANRTPRELARLIWQMFGASPQWGKRRIAMTIRALGVFIAASTVRNVLLRPRPRDKAPTAAILPAAAQMPTQRAARQTVAPYPNHVWSVDVTRVYRWGLWPTPVVVAIDHFSRRVTTVTAAFRSSGAWTATAVQAAFERCGAPRHLITDQQGLFTAEEFANALWRWGVRHRFGAVGQHGSIAVTERVIRTLKQEWLSRVLLIGRMNHLAVLLADFETYYDQWRPHLTLNGAVPEAVWLTQPAMKPERWAKTVPLHIEQHRFRDARVTAYRPAQSPATIN